LLQLKNRTKKERKEINTIKVFLVLVSGFFGWYQAETFKGVLISAFVAIVILALFGVWRSTAFKKRMEQSGIAAVDEMTDTQFDEHVGTLFKNQGYDVTFTPLTGNYGADLILKRGRGVIVVLVKRAKNTVGITAVQEVIPAIRRYNATSAWVVSNSSYSKEAVDLAEQNRVLLLDRVQLIQISVNQKNEIGEFTTIQRSNNNIEEAPVAATIEENPEDTSNYELELLLNEFRLKISEREERDILHIFTNKTLDELVEKRPISIGELQKIKGFGKKRTDDFGEALVKVIRG